MAKRTKANGEGTIYRRKGAWAEQYTYQSAEGPKRRTLYGASRQEVADKLARALSERGSALASDAGSLTLSEYLDRYLDDARGRLRPKPFNRAEGLVRNHVKPALGQVKLKDLTPAHLRSLYAAKLDCGLSGRTVGYIHVTLYSALKAAVLDGLLPRNPASAVKPPRMDKQEMTPLSPAEARVLLDAARQRDDRWSALYVLAVTTGLRQGELLGLRWEDVDPGSATLRVRHTLQPPGFPKGSPARLTPPKTRRSLRAVALPHSAVGALLRHRELQDAERSGSNGSWQDRGFVFPNTLGGPMDYTNLMPRHFKPLLRRAGLPDIRFHDLRHTCATLLHQGCTPKDSLRDARALERRDHLGCLQPRHPRPGRGCGDGDGRRVGRRSRRWRRRWRSVVRVVLCQHRIG